MPQAGRWITEATYALQEPAAAPEDLQEAQIAEAPAPWGRAASQERRRREEEDAAMREDPMWDRMQPVQPSPQQELPRPPFGWDSSKGKGTGRGSHKGGGKSGWGSSSRGKPSHSGSWDHYRGSSWR